ncbi:Uncharacterized protein ChrSV_0617 [Chromobacterium vaccinii]|uniref:Acetylgalactosaminyl-proteoglycan 3-beta-glucuronosyltransferase n=1 Tax=Chromobacterium phragmitis TaxID=2202141 RepID=A0A344UI76_9NEIS|nr:MULTISPECIES: glycosyltransferase [Chromobacterium]AXE34974.1 acetylgalactosaminyl-proteoglycan 3-beta-glucuronosyltransferase [Chromobacterium phragmitis]QND82845.1 Uncharacterized protein ChrSW_0617 [Chromobacterium vaccinii]QND88076.1 Uncharacterized protein ChrSV_0617 [Chromobacterium vaccinii]
MTILNQAISAYRNNDFSKALQLFYQAGERYGSNLVATNIRLCQQALTEAGQPSACAPLISAKLDPATRIMLANAMEFEITETERNRLLTEYRSATLKKSEEVDAKPVNPIPADWPKDLKLPTLPEGPNDYRWNAQRKKRLGISQTIRPGISILIPTYNRANILSITLACLVNQKTRYPFEVIVVDDGSREAISDVVKLFEDKLDIKYFRHPDNGFRVSAVRNAGLKLAKYDLIGFLDCDMAPCPEWVQSFVELLLEDEDLALIGPRKYVDTTNMPPSDFLKNTTLLGSLPEVVTNNMVAGKIEQGISVDWRLDHFSKSENLRLCDSPFRYFAAGNIAFSKKWIEKIGGFDESFSNWGGEDLEFGYRLFRAGCFFRSVPIAMAYHQEPPGKENETDRAEGKKITQIQMWSCIPYFYRKPKKLEESTINKAPLVSIYIPAYNCRDSIIKCVNSALNQTIVDLEVCICNDGSTDDTLAVIQQSFGNHPRVKIVDKKNGGIGSASNAAVQASRGYYIGQLDSDDYLEPDAVELCLKEFLADKNLACVYTTYRNIDPNGKLLNNGYNFPTYSREKLMTAMIAHHFRMFSMRAWSLTEGFNEEITNAVDYDMYLKLSEVGEFKHINKIAYNRVLHGENTSIKKLDVQKRNHFHVVKKSFSRLKIMSHNYIALNPDDAQCRKYILKRKTQL